MDWVPFCSTITTLVSVCIYRVQLSLNEVSAAPSAKDVQQHPDTGILERAGIAYTHNNDQILQPSKAAEHQLLAHKTKAKLHRAMPKNYHLNVRISTGQGSFAKKGRAKEERGC